MAMVHCFAATDVGHVRTSNEDCYATSGGIERDRWSGELDPMRGWALVADGMGAHAAGEVASALAAAHLASVLPSVTDLSGLADAVEQTNRLLFETMALQPEFTGMGTTVGGVCYEAERLVAFNVGDSRIYAYENGRLAQLSEDHVVHGHFLTQCLGGYASPTSVEPNIVERELIRPSRALLCSDGLTDAVADREIAALLQSDDPAATLVHAALASGGPDNVTAVVLDFR